MNQCVPSWDLDNTPAPPRIAPTNSLSLLDYEVAELTWENGQLAMHGLGPPRVANKPTVTSTWEKPSSGGGTLESVVNQATCHPLVKSARGENLSDLVPWFNNNRATTNTNPSVHVSGTAITLDALVPCNNNHEQSTNGTYEGECSTGVGSCTPAAKTCVRVARAGTGRTKTGNVHSVSVSVSESGTCGGRDSYQVTLDTCELGGAGFTSSPETSSGKEYTKTSGEDHDSVCHSRPPQRKGGNEDGKKKLGINGKSSSSLMKRSRAAAIHNQSERKRRDKINHKMKTLQKMVPNSNKTDKASMLDEVIEYMKQLQAQVNMMSRMSMPLTSMMLPLPLAMQQQLQMSMMGMGMGMGFMDINSIAGGHSNTMMSPAAFMSMPPWENPSDRMPTENSVVPEHLNAFLACQAQQPMNMDAYTRLAAMYQHFQQNPGTGPKN